MKPNKTMITALVGAALMGGTMTAIPAAATTWQPTASERLVKLPGNHLERAVESDARRSELGLAIRDAEERIQLKTQALEDLQGAIDAADGDLRTELNHLFLLEKQAYLNLMKESQSLRRKEARTKLKLYERLLGKMDRKQSSRTSGQVALKEKHDAALARFEQTRQAIDTKIMQSSLTAESPYARSYAENLAAIENLQRAIDDHPMNRAPERFGVPLTQADYLRDLVARHQSELNIIDQESQMLGFMAKLVSLDALALSEGINEAALDEDWASPEQQESSISSAVSLFTGF
ncbi:MAG: hypothetical protein ACPGOV_06595 [Magnetovibrionaceae bacterium]